MTTKPDDSFDGICSHCRKPVSLEDLVMWVNHEPIEMYFVHQKVTNPECDPAMTSFLNALYPDKNELTEHIRTFIEGISIKNGQARIKMQGITIVVNLP